MAHNDEVCDLMAENGNLKQLLVEILPNLKAYQAHLIGLWPGPEVLLICHRNETLIRKVEDATKGFQAISA